MKTVSCVLVAIAGIAFAAGVVIKLFLDPAGLPAWLAPVTLWRGAVGSLGFAAILLLMDIRELLAKKG